MPNTTLPRFASYRPAQGGHAPGDLRDALLEVVENLRSWRRGDPEPSAEVRGQALPLCALCGLLWNCSDIIARIEGDLIAEFLEMQGWDEREAAGASVTYARAARALRIVFARPSAQSA